MELDRSHVKLFVVLVFIALAIFVVKPFIITLLLAAIVAYLVYPLHERLTKKIGNGGSALLLTLAVLVIITYIAYNGVNLILNEITNLYSFLSQINLEEISPALKDSIQIISATFVEQVSSTITKAVHFMLSLTIFFVSLFYFLKDGDEIFKSISAYIPFGKEHTDKIVKEIRNNIDSYVHVQVVIGITQGIVGAIGFYIFGIPYAFIGGIAIAIFSILPIIGTYAVYVPVAFLSYQLYGLNTAAGILVYGLIFGSILDYIVRPYFYGKRMKLNPVVTFLGIFGGMQLFGFVGIILGPILLSISISLLKELRIRNG